MRCMWESSMPPCVVRATAWLSDVHGAAGAPAASDSQPQAKKPGPFDSREQFEANLLKQARPSTMRRTAILQEDRYPSVSTSICWRHLGL